MRLLISQLNVDAPSADFPYGRIRNNPGNATGTAFNEALYGDIQQFFARMFALSGIAANGIADGNYGGWQLFEALRKTALPYKVYSAEVTQSSTNAPVVTVMPGNQIGSIVWARTGVGTYTGTLSLAFDSNLTQAFNGTMIVGQIQITKTSQSVLTISTFAAGVPADGVLNGTSIEIRVYQL